MTAPSTRKIRAFWDWFATIATELGTDLQNQRLLDQLDHRVTTDLGVMWEVGPGHSARTMLALSPDGDRDLLPVTRRIVALAPTIAGWELLPARPVKQWSLGFALKRDCGADLEVDASSWRYALRVFKDGAFGIVVEANSLPDATQDEREMAARIVLDGVLGEARRLETIVDIECVQKLDRRTAAGATDIEHLADHLLELSLS